jgi:hypothetical protein
LRLALRAESGSGLQGKILHVQYSVKGGRYGVYASAFWGSIAGQTFVVLLAPPAGATAITLSPVLVDNEGRLWLADIQVVEVP